MTRARSAAAAAAAAPTAAKQREPVVVDLEMNDEEEEVVEAAGEEDDENVASANGAGNDMEDAANEEEDAEANEATEEDGDGEEENEEEAEGGGEEFGDHEEDAEHGDGMEEAEGEEKETEESKPVARKEVSKDPLDRPPHGSEVFLGGIGRDVSDDEVREFCLPCGEVYEVRLVVDRETGQCKGYGFVTFMNKDSAQKAIETLNDTEFKSKKIRVTPSQSKHRLFIGNIPKLWTKEELLKALSEESAGIESVDLLQDPSNPHKNRGFAFVEYYNHAAAEQARRVLSKQSFLLGGRTPTVNYAENRTEPDAAAMAQVKVVYVRNLPESVTEDDLRKLFEKHGDITKIILPIPKPGQPKRDFGFIHFAERSSAVAAIDKDEKYEVDGRALECSLAKPPAEKRAPPPPESSYPVRGGTAGLLPQYQPQRSTAYAYQAAGAHAGYGHVGVRAYAAAQPVIYGRGPTPAGMTMVPMMLPDGTVGYVLQQPGQMQPAAAYRRAGTQNMITYAHSGAPIGRQDRRYRPY